MVIHWNYNQFMPMETWMFEKRAPPSQSCIHIKSVIMIYNNNSLSYSFQYRYFIPIYIHQSRNIHGGEETIVSGLKIETTSSRAFASEFKYFLSNLILNYVSLLYYSHRQKRHKTTWAPFRPIAFFLLE